MKKLMMTCLLIIGSSALATDGNSTGCFGLAIPVPKSFATAKPTGSVLVSTNGSICVTEKNMNFIDPDRNLSLGEITIKIYDGKKEVAHYEMGAATTEGALGTAYTAYGKTDNDALDQSDENRGNLIIFAMRNDHIKKGQLAGRVEMNGTSMSLIQQ